MFLGNYGAMLFLHIDKPNHDFQTCCALKAKEVGAQPGGGVVLMVAEATQKYFS